MRPRPRAALLACLVLLAASRVDAALQTDQERAQNEPLEPFRIAGNLYYVGANEVTSYLVATPASHILIDSGFEDTVPQVLHNLETLAFGAADVKVLLTTQAHYDHVGGIAGGSTLVAHLTPGHTPGCTSWAMNEAARAAFEKQLEEQRRAAATAGH